ncbi:MAG TPA: hypothetical protein VFG07_07895 [Thermoplasmata archaeon]|nr:hypothetical protein [Thermoplasmata archaeon]
MKPQEYLPPRRTIRTGKLGDMLIDEGESLVDAIPIGGLRVSVVSQPLSVGNEEGAYA